VQFLIHDPAIIVQLATKATKEEKVLVLSQAWNDGASLAVL
jgi:hypothetical protein